jgi:hypothetical protein
VLDPVALPIDVGPGPELLAVGVAPAEAEAVIAALVPDVADPVTETEGLAEGFRVQAGPSRF